MKQNRLAYLLTIVFFWSACGIALAESQLQTGCSVTADEQTDLTIDCIKIGGVTYKGILNYIGIQKTENGDDLYLWEYPGGGQTQTRIFIHRINAAPWMQNLTSHSPALSCLTVMLRIIMIMNTHSYDREHLLYSRIGSDVFLL